MNRYRNILPMLMALLVLAALIRLAAVAPMERQAWLPALLFEFLVVFTTSFSAPLSSGVVSLLPMITISSFLVLGFTPASWLAYAGAFIYGFIRHSFASQLGYQVPASRLEAVSRTAAEATVQAISILSAGAIYLLVGGDLPFLTLDSRSAAPLAAMGLTYLSMSYVMSGLFLGIRETPHFNSYIKLLPSVLIYEGVPLVAAPLIALTYNQLGLRAFILFGLAIIAVALVMRNLAISRLRMERQLREMDSLQAVGQALATTLDLHEVLMAVYRQVIRIMPVETFFVALYDEENDELVFPLVIENNVEISWPPQRGGRDYVDHLVRARSTAGGREKTDVLRRTFGLSISQRPVTSWLAVPIQAGDDQLGVISVQSHSKFNLYDATHEELLAAIASQAALAIQNARLYARTDLALARRVQELDSILRSVGEGILLLDLSFRVVALNRTLSDYLDLPASKLFRIPLLGSQNPEALQLLQGIGYSPESLQDACEELLKSNADQERHTITLTGREPRQVERTHTAVRDRQRNVSGWLFVFRDLSEEIELQELREDMMHMLVHDLRSPLAVFQSSLSSLPELLDQGNLAAVRKLVDLSQRGVNRLLGLVSDILDIAKLENGSLPLRSQQVDLRRLLEEAVEQVAPLADQANISIHIAIDHRLPQVVLDPSLMGRVISNLLDNSVKFSPRGGQVSLWAAGGLTGSSEMVWIGVSDSGPGIPVEKRKQVFEKFAQLDTPGARRAGTGLGLHYCKLAVETHGGKIWVESRLDQGSTFVIQLPIHSGKTV